MTLYRRLECSGIEWLNHWYKVSSISYKHCKMQNQGLCKNYTLKSEISGTFYTKCTIRKMINLHCV